MVFFGAHIFSQFLLYMGLDQKQFNGILDNSKIKIGKRLYGTSLKVFNPLIIEGKEKVNIIVKAGQYQKEVEEQLLSLNSNIKIHR